MKDQLTLTIDTTNVLVLNETASMLQRIANAQCPAMPMAVPTAPIAAASDVDGALSATITPMEAFDMRTEPTLSDPDGLDDSWVKEPEADGVTGQDPELDTSGMPWDERIHTATRSKVKDGTWMFKRGLTEDVKNAVLAEYGTQVDTEIAGWDEIDSEETIPAPPEAIPAPPAPPAPATPTGMTFQELMPLIRGKVEPQVAIEACKSLGIPNLIALNLPANQHLISEVALLLGL